MTDDQLNADANEILDFLAAHELGIDLKPEAWSGEIVIPDDGLDISRFTMPAAVVAAAALVALEQLTDLTYSEAIAVVRALLNRSDDETPTDD